MILQKGGLGVVNLYHWHGELVLLVCHGDGLNFFGVSDEVNLLFCGW